MPKGCKNNSRILNNLRAKKVLVHWYVHLNQTGHLKIPLSMYHILNSKSNNDRVNYGNRRFMIFVSHY